MTMLNTSLVYYRNMFPRLNEHKKQETSNVWLFGYTIDRVWSSKTQRSSENGILKYFVNKGGFCLFFVVLVF